MSTPANRARRRASAAIFKRETRGHVDTYLVEVGDIASFNRLPFLSRAVEGTVIRKCVGCRADFTADTRPAAHLFAMAPTTSTAVWAFCVKCWALSPDEIERLSVKAFKKLVPNGSLDPRRN